MNSTTKNSEFCVMNYLRFRYTPHTRKIKELVAQKAIGEVINIQRVEPVGSWHFAHSYVRGNWYTLQKNKFQL